MSSTEVALCSCMQLSHQDYIGKKKKTTKRSHGGVATERRLWKTRGTHWRVQARITQEPAEQPPKNGQQDPDEGTQGVRRGGKVKVVDPGRAWLCAEGDLLLYLLLPWRCPSCWAPGRAIKLTSLPSHPHPSQSRGDKGGAAVQCGSHDPTCMTLQPVLKRRLWGGMRRRQGRVGAPATLQDLLLGPFRREVGRKELGDL